MTKNKHKLPRSVPAEVRRTLRKEAGFGCVKCGRAFGEYEHIDPEFADAKVHDPAKMAFLCKACHGEVTAGRATKQSVWDAKRAPFCKASKMSWGPLAFGSLYSRIGNLEFVDCRVLLRVCGEDLLKIEPPEEDGGPIRVSVTIYDGANLSLKIEDNAFVIGGENWDVEIVGQVLTIKKALREPSLIYRFNPSGGIVIDRIAMRYKGIKVNVDREQVSIGTASCKISASHSTFVNCSSCISTYGTSIFIGGIEFADGVSGLVGCVIEGS